MGRALLVERFTMAKVKQSLARRTCLHEMRFRDCTSVMHDCEGEVLGVIGSHIGQTCAEDEMETVRRSIAIG